MVSRKPHCLLLEARDNQRYYLSFYTDEDLYRWHDDLYSLSPLTLSMGVLNESDNDLHALISGYSVSASV